MSILHLISLLIAHALVSGSVTGVSGRISVCRTLNAATRATAETAVEILRRRIGSKSSGILVSLLLLCASKVR